MSKKGFRCKIHDWYGLHSDYFLLLRPGYTALVGPNGAGKTTLLLQLDEIARQRGYLVFNYSNLTDGGNTAMGESLIFGNMSRLAEAATSSEGQQIAMNFGNVLDKIGAMVKKAIEEDKPLFILLDSLDSGTSINLQREMMSLFSLIERDAGVHSGGAEHEIYIVAAVNSYELAKRICVDVRTGKSMVFGGYEEYANFICGYYKKEEK